jgi:hypothetical protein
MVLKSSKLVNFILLVVLISLAIWLHDVDTLSMAVMMAMETSRFAKPMLWWKVSGATLAY